MKTSKKKPPLNQIASQENQNQTKSQDTINQTRRDAFKVMLERTKNLHQDPEIQKTNPKPKPKPKTTTTQNTNTNK